MNWWKMNFWKWSIRRKKNKVSLFLWIVKQFSNETGSNEVHSKIPKIVPAKNKSSLSVENRQDSSKSYSSEDDELENNYDMDFNLAQIKKKASAFDQILSKAKPVSRGRGRGKASSKKDISDESDVPPVSKRGRGRGKVASKKKNVSSDESDAPSTSRRGRAKVSKKSEISEEENEKMEISESDVPEEYIEESEAEVIVPSKRKNVAKPSWPVRRK